MDHILTLDYQYKDKFARMRKWIIDNKKLSKEFFNKIEKSIIVTYKEIGRHKGFPPELHKIFTVDLCSDDEGDKSTETNTNGTPTVLQTKTVTISDNEPDDDVEIVYVSKSNVVDLTKDKDFGKERCKRSEIPDLDVDINEEIFIRINATNPVRSDSPRVPTPPMDANYSVETSENQDRLIFRRRKDFTENEISNTEVNNITQEQYPSDEIRPKIKKKKKKHKKDKHHRHCKNRFKKKNYKVVDNIVIDSSTDDESAINKSSETDVPQAEETLSGINKLNEQELLKIKRIIMSEIVSDAKQANQSKEMENEKPQKNINENLMNRTTDNFSNKELDENELLQMKDNLMKTIGVDINTSKLLENINLSELNNGPSSPKNNFVGRNIPILISNTPRATENSTRANSGGYRNISTNQAHYHHPVPHQSLPIHQNYMPNMDVPIHTMPPLPVPSPNNVSPYLTGNTLSTSIRYQSSNLIDIPTTATPMPIPTHFNGTTQLSNETNYGCRRETSSLRPPPLLPKPQQSLPSPAEQLFHPAVAQQLLPPLTHQLDRPPTQMFHSAVIQEPRPPITQPLFPAAPQKPHSTLSCLLQAPAQEPHSTLAHLLQAPPKQPFHRAAQQPLMAPPQQPLMAPPQQPLMAPPQQPLMAPPEQPFYPPISQQPCPSASQPLHPAFQQPRPALLEAPSQPYNQLMSQQNFSSISQPLHPPTSSQPYSSLSPRMQNVTSVPPPSFSMPPPPLSQRPTLAPKDPRIRKICEQGQYANNRPTAGTTKSPFNYGAYKEKQRQKELDEENRKRMEAAERERIREENRKKIQKEKEQEAIELTESIRKILTAKNVEGFLNEMVSKKDTGSLNQKNASPDNKLKEAIDKIRQDDNTPKVMERRKSCSSKSRALKELECTVKGFNTMKDFLPLSNDGKRRSSLSARKAIASLLTPPSETEKEQEKSNANKSKSPPKKRISIESVDDDVEQAKRARMDLEMRVKRAKCIPKVKKCKVVIQRLSLSQIDRYTKKSDKHTKSTTTSTTPSKDMATVSTKTFPLLERISPKKLAYDKLKSQEKTYARKSTDAFMDVKNIDCEMTERNCDRCVLCKSRSTNLTNHYIRVHKRESYLSRLTWEELDDLQMKVPFAQEVTEKKSSETNKKVQRFKVECPFCPEEKREVIGSFAILRQHFSMHTGEYAYQCKGCGLQKPLRKDVIDHQKRKKCYGMGLQTLYLYPTDLMVIYMYVCNICNFVQLNEENVYKHLREQHGKLNRDTKLVKQFTLAAIKDGPLERVPVGNFAEIIPAMETFFDSDLFNQADNENIVVGNEPHLDDSFTNIFKPELLDVENEFEWETAAALQSQSKLKLCKEASEYSQNANVGEFLETSVVDIKPDINTFDQNNLENGKQPQQQLSVPEATATAKDEKDSKPDVEQLTVESAKALLRKITANTGIRPDLLFQCPKSDCRGYYSNFNLWFCHMNQRHNSFIATCPHCKNPKNIDDINSELPLADFEEHFKTHCMRLYVCFHCDVQCIDKAELEAHAKTAHANFQDVRIECIPFSPSYAYYVLVNKSTLTVRLEFLLELCNILRARIQRMETSAEESDSKVSQWTVSNSPAWLDDLSIPIYHSEASKPKCMFPECVRSFTSPLDLVDHWMENHTIYKDKLFTCILCDTLTTSKTLKKLVTHYFMHAENIFVCCVCSYVTYDRKLLSQHICAEHDKRDVGVLVLERSLKFVKVKIEFVFATDSKTFSTTNSCFCGCGVKNLRVGTFVSHLKREHSLKLHYFCEHCNEPLLQLQSCDEHFLLKHAAETGVSVKIRCQLACSNDRDLNILSIRPMQIRLSDENYENFQNDFGSPKKVRIIPQNESNPEIDGKDDDEPIIMDDDEIVAENEAKQARPAQITERRDISVKNIWKLF